MVSLIKQQVLNENGDDSVFCSKRHAMVHHLTAQVKSDEQTASGVTATWPPEPGANYKRRETGMRRQTR